MVCVAGSLSTKAPSQIPSAAASRQGVKSSDVAVMIGILAKGEAKDTVTPVSPAGITAVPACCALSESVPWTCTSPRKLASPWTVMSPSTCRPCRTMRAETSRLLPLSRTSDPCWSVSGPSTATVTRVERRVFFHIDVMDGDTDGELAVDLQHARHEEDPGHGACHPATNPPRCAFPPTMSVSRASRVAAVREPVRVRVLPVNNGRSDAPCCDSSPLGSVSDPGVASVAPLSAAMLASTAANRSVMLSMWREEICRVTSLVIGAMMRHLPRACPSWTGTTAEFHRRSSVPSPSGRGMRRQTASAVRDWFLREMSTWTVPWPLGVSSIRHADCRFAGLGPAGVAGSGGGSGSRIPRPDGRA